MSHESKSVFTTPQPAIEPKASKTAPLPSAVQKTAMLKRRQKNVPKASARSSNEKKIGEQELELKNKHELELKADIREIQNNLPHANFDATKKAVKALVCKGLPKSVANDMQELFANIITHYKPLTGVEFVIENTPLLADPSALVLLAAENLPHILENFLLRESSTHTPIKILKILLTSFARHASQSPLKEDSENILKFADICYEALSIAAGKIPSRELMPIFNEVDPKVWDCLFGIVSGMRLINWNLLLDIHKIDCRPSPQSLEKLALHAESLWQEDKNLERVHLFCQKLSNDRAGNQAPFIAGFLNIFFLHLLKEKKAHYVNLWENELNKTKDPKLKNALFDFHLEKQNYREAFKIGKSLNDKCTTKLFVELCVRQDERAIHFLLENHHYFALFPGSSSVIGRTSIYLSQASRFEESLRLLHRYEIDNFTYWKSVLERIWEIGTLADKDLGERFYQSQLNKGSFLHNFPKTKEWDAMMAQMKGSSKKTWFCQDSSSEELLQKSIKNGDFPLFNAMRHIASVNKSLPDGEPALHLAIKHGQVEMIKPLLEAGAELVCNWQGLTPFDLAVQSNQKKSLLAILGYFLLEKERAGLEAQILSKAKTEATTELLSHIAALSTLPKNASSYGKEIYSGTLNPINLPANLNQLDESGLAPLHYAILGCQEDILHELLQRRANVENKTSQGVSALHLAAAAGSPSMVLQLIREGLDVNGFDAEKLTPLHYAAAKGRMEVFSILVKAGGNPLAQERQGISPLALFGCISYLKDPLLLPTRQSFFFATMLTYGISSTFGNLSPADQLFISISSSLILNHEALLNACSHLASGNRKLIPLAAMIGVGILAYFPLEDMLNAAFDPNIMTAVYGAFVILNTYRIGMDSLQGLKKCWENAAFRPIRASLNAVVCIGNLAFLGGQLRSYAEFVRDPMHVFKNQPDSVRRENITPAKPAPIASGTPKVKQEKSWMHHKDEVFALIKKGPVIIQKTEQYTTAVYTHEQYIEFVAGLERLCMSLKAATVHGNLLPGLRECNAQAVENLGKWHSYTDFIGPEEGLKVITTMLNR